MRSFTARLGRGQLEEVADQHQLQAAPRRQPLHLRPALHQLVEGEVAPSGAVVLNAGIGGPLLGEHMRDAPEPILDTKTKSVMILS